VAVIHGVGATNPGDTLEALVKNLLTWDGTRRLEEKEPFEVRMLPQQEEPHLPRTDAERQGRPFNVNPRREPPAMFPMHVRRVRVAGHPRDGTPAEGVFAEVYWSDLSAGSSVWWQLLVRVFTLLFDVSFLADQAAMLPSRFRVTGRALARLAGAAVPQAVLDKVTALRGKKFDSAAAFLKHAGLTPDEISNSGRAVLESASAPGLASSRLLRPCLYFASWLLCGPIGALNLFVVFLVAAHFVVPLVGRWLELMNQHQNATSAGLGSTVGVVALCLGFWGMNSWRALDIPRRDNRYLLLVVLFAASALLGMSTGLVLSELFLEVDWQGPQSVWDRRLLNLCWLLAASGLVFLLAGAGLCVRVAFATNKKQLDREQWKLWKNVRLIAAAVLMATGLGLSVGGGLVVKAAPFPWLAARLGAWAVPVAAFFWLAVWCEKTGIAARLGEWWRDRVLWCLADILAAGAALVVCFGPFDLLNDVACSHPTRLGDVAAIGYGVTACVLCLTLWRWGDRSGWNFVWILLYFSGAAAALAGVGLAVYRLHISPDVFWTSPAGTFIHDRVPVRPTGDAFEAQLAGLLCAIGGLFSLLAVLLWASTLIWALALWESRRKGKTDPEIKRPEPAPAPPKTLTYLDIERPGLDAALGATMLQTGIWVLFAPVLGLLALSRLAPDQVAADNPLFTRVWTSFAVNISIAALILLIALAVWAGRMWWAGVNLPPYTREQARGINRLLVSGWLIYPLIATTCLVGGYFAMSYCWPHLREWQDGMLNHWGPIIVAGVGAVLTVLYVLFRSGLRAGLHIITDVISHFYRQPQPNPLGAAPFSDEPSEFDTEMKIESRVRRVLEELMTKENVTHLTVVAHSQGTVIAIHTLYLRWTRALVGGLAPERRRLVTMGSPFTHLYQFYFPRRYPPLHWPDGTFNTVAWFHLHDNVGSWLNVYRVDDFVGTEIFGSDTFPVNQPIRAGGHTDYWSDPRALWPLLEHLPGPTLPPPPRP
jgi:hypothetical protein